MIGCWAGTRLLGAYLDGEVTAAAAARIGSHVEGCPRCRAELTLHRRIGEALGRGAPIDEGAAQRLRAFAEGLPVEGVPAEGSPVEGVLDRETADRV